MEKTTVGRLAGGTRIGSIIASTKKEHWCPNGKHKFDCASADCNRAYEQNCEAHQPKE